MTGDQRMLALGGRAVDSRERPLLAPSSLEIPTRAPRAIPPNDVSHRVDAERRFSKATGEVTA
jgi:hypothetical protein